MVLPFECLAMRKNFSRSERMRVTKYLDALVVLGFALLITLPGAQTVHRDGWNWDQKEGNWRKYGEKCDGKPGKNPAATVGLPTGYNPVQCGTLFYKFKGESGKYKVTLVQSLYKLGGGSSPVKFYVEGKMVKSASIKNVSKNTSGWNGTYCKKKDGVLDGYFSG